jgi:protoporphyrinogen/coproporphyrinogen III oxidase
LGISDEIEYIPDTHIAAKNRFIFSNGKLNSFSKQNKSIWLLFQIVFLFLDPNVTLGKRDDKLASYFLYNELKGIPRASNIKDESIHDFMSRRFGSDFTEKIVDPYFNSICYGDIKELSSFSLLKGLYSAESKYGSITKGYMRGRKECKILNSRIRFT